jgi:hypothetical protein
MHPLARIHASSLLSVTDPPQTIDGARRRLERCWLELADYACRRLPHYPCVPPPGDLSSSHAYIGADDDDSGPSDVGPMPETPVMAPEDCAAVTADPVGWFTAEAANLTAVTLDACRRGRHHLAAELAARQFSAHCQLRAYDTAREQWNSVASAARRAGDSLAAARARYHIAVLAVRHGEFRVGPVRAERELIACLREFYFAKDAVALADTQYLLAMCALHDDHAEAARRFALQGLEAGRSLDDQRLTFLHLSALGVVLAGLRSADEGIARCHEAADIAAGLKEPRYRDLAADALTQARYLIDHPPAWSWIPPDSSDFARPEDQEHSAG